MPILFNILHWVSGLTLISLSFYCLKRASNKLGLHLCLFLFLLSIWSLCAALTYNVSSIEMKINLVRMRHIGISMIPISLLYLIRCFAGYRPLPLYARIGLFIVPCVSILIIVSPFHEYFLNSYQIRNIFGMNLLTFANGPIFYFHNITGRVIVLWALALLVAGTKGQGYIQKRYSWILFFSILLPFAIDSFAVGLSPTFRYLQVVPVFLTFSAACFCSVSYTHLTLPTKA